MKTWNERLNWAIEHRRVTKAALARACSVTRPSIGEWTDGTTGDPKLEPFFAACAFLNVRPQWLALGEEPIEPEPTLNSTLVQEIAQQLVRRPEEAQRRVLDLILQIPESEDRARPGQARPAIAR